MNDVSNGFDVTRQNFAALVLEASKHNPVLVDFWAPWCGPCKMLAPALATLASEYRGGFRLAKVNTDDEQMLAREYGIRSLPTVKVFKDGRVVDEFTGVLAASAIRAIIERHIEHEVDKIRRRAEAAFEGGDANTALRLLKEAAEMGPNDTSVKVLTARILMLTGTPEEARSLLQSLPMDASLTAEVKRLQAQLEFAQTANEAFDEADLERKISDDPRDLQARYRLSARRVMRGDYEGALEQLFEVMRRDRSFENDVGRRGILSVFEILGGGELVSRYRRKMVHLLH
jgi:putative thioredoxin